MKSFEFLKKKIHKNQSHIFFVILPVIVQLCKINLEIFIGDFIEKLLIVDYKIT
jgi:hypothetical protein